MCFRIALSPMWRLKYNRLISSAINYNNNRHTQPSIQSMVRRTMFQCSSLRWCTLPFPLVCLPDSDAPRLPASWALVSGLVPWCLGSMVPYLEVSLLMNGTDDSSGLGSMSTLGRALAPFRGSPLVQARGLGSAGSAIEIGWILVPGLGGTWYRWGSRWWCW